MESRMDTGSTLQICIYVKRFSRIWAESWRIWAPWNAQQLLWWRPPLLGYGWVPAITQIFPLMFLKMRQNCPLKVLEASSRTWKACTTWLTKQNSMLTNMLAIRNFCLLWHSSTRFWLNDINLTNSDGTIDTRFQISIFRFVCTIASRNMKHMIFYEFRMLSD